MERVYFDSCATTKPCAEAITAARRAMEACYYNPSAAYPEGRDVKNKVLDAKKVIAASINASPDEIYFTSGGTESVNTALFGVMETGKKGALILSSVEHPAAENAGKELERRKKEVLRAPFINGALDLDALEKLLTPEVKLCSFMAVQNETGYVFPLEEIRALLEKKAPGALLHIDGVQGYGKIILDVKRQNIDLLSLSSHKIHGIKGTGALYIKRGLSLRPLLFGGGQESSLRSGTENTPGILAFSAAVDRCFSDISAYRETLFALRGYARERLQTSGLSYLENSPPDGADHILNLSLPGIPSEVMVNYLGANGALVSAGSACSSGKRAENKVLLNAGLPPERASSALRISFSPYNTKKEIDFLIELLINCEKELKL